MAHPKRKHSNTRTRKRRSQDFLTSVGVGVCSNCGTAVMPHRICPNCGYYRGRQVITVMKPDSAAKEK
ncbi:MAG: 50S ribosomal protein L32 [Candidatus Omnitrophica bacterium]|nr:50S ribosomal protein L32 [Candidatus Omnitrophota bacterium]